MKIKLPFVFLCALLFCITTSAQSLSPTVISTSGAFYSNSSGMLSSTVGEMTMVETFSKPSSILTQGFQQPEDFSISVPDVNDPDAFLQVSPNPGSGIFTLSFSSVNASKMAITVLDETGRAVMLKQYEKSSIAADFRLNLDHLAAGYYFLYCIASGTNNENVKMIYQKISIIK